VTVIRMSTSGHLIVSHTKHSTGTVSQGSWNSLAGTSHMVYLVASTDQITHLPQCCVVAPLL